MLNKQGLLHIIQRAEEGRLLSGEAQILRDAVELLDDLSTLVNRLAGSPSATPVHAYSPESTMEIRAVSDDAWHQRP